MLGRRWKLTTYFLLVFTAIYFGDKNTKDDEIENIFT